MADPYDRFDRFERQVLALAAVAQSAALVNSLAVRGQASEQDLITSANTLISLEPGSMAAIVPSPAQLSLGLRSLQQALADQKAPDSALITRYTLSMLHLRGRLLAHADMVADLQATLSRLQPLDVADFPSADENPEPAVGSAEFAQGSGAEENLAGRNSIEFFAEVAELYQRTVSKLQPRIQVSGRAEYLQDEKRAQKIRTLLLAGIRAAVLWHQLGGRRWLLILQRRRAHGAAGEIRRKLLTVSD